MRNVIIFKLKCETTPESFALKLITVLPLYVNQIASGNTEMRIKFYWYCVLIDF